MQCLRLRRMLAACQPGTKLDLNILAFPINFHIMQPHPFRWDAGPVAWRNADSEWDSSVASHSSQPYTSAHIDVDWKTGAHNHTCSIIYAAISADVFSTRTITGIENRALLSVMWSILGIEIECGLTMRQLRLRQLLSNFCCSWVSWI